MQALYPKLVEADALVLASPIYWFTYSSMFRYLRAPIIGMVYGTASDPGDVLKEPALMQAAYELDRKLAEVNR